MGNFLQKRRLRIETRTRFLFRRIKSGNRPKLVVFLHIPKTAGTSVMRYLTECLGSRRSGDCVRLNYKNNFGTQINNVDFGKIMFLSGHFGWRQLQETDGEHRFTFTFLRKPSERLVSWYHYVQASNAKKLGVEKEDPAIFFENVDQSRCMINNLMVRQLSGDMDEVPQTDARWRELLEQAKANLCRLDYVGFQETFSNDFAQIVDLIGLPPFKTAPRINVTSDIYKGHSAEQKELEFDATTREKIRELTRWDTELYDYALSEFR